MTLFMPLLVVSLRLYQYIVICNRHLSMANNILKCTINNETNVIRIFPAKKLVEPKPSKSHKRKMADGGYSTGRWTKEEHINFIKGNSFSKNVI